MIGDKAELYLDADRWGGAYPLIRPDGLDATKPQFVVGDIMSLHLRWLKQAATIGGSLVAQALPGSWAIVLAVKSSRDDDADILASTSDFGLVASGGDTYYTGVLSLATDPAIAVGTEPISVWVDVEVSDAGATRKLTWQFPATINPQTYNNETAPTPAEPTYPAPGAIPVRCVGATAIPIGSTTLDIVLAGDRDVVPVTVVRKPSAAADDIFVLSTYDLTMAGFSVSLSAAPTQEGYYVDYIAF